MIILIRQLSFVFLIQLFYIVGVQAAAVCGDFLTEIGGKPAGVEFKGCKIHKDHQLHLEAEYRLSGKRARLVAALLKQQFKMGDLRFMCCGWQATPTGSYTKIVKGVEYIYIIVMYSHESTEKDWNKIPWFYINVKLYPGTI